LYYRVICTLPSLNSLLKLHYRHLASRFKGIGHFLAVNGLLVAIIGAAMIYGLPTERKVARLMCVYIHPYVPAVER
jgi:hypothetical protein